MTNLAPRVVVVNRRTEYQHLIERHGTHGQAAFFLQSRRRSIDDLQQRHHRQATAVQAVSAAIPPKWRRAAIERQDLSRFVFAPEDIVVAVGQDGLVANLAKYLHGQPVIGVNPDPSRYDGVLVKHTATNVQRLIAGAANAAVQVEARAMVQAELDDGQKLCALNEIFVGHKTHQSARYQLQFEGQRQSHSSSGLIVATGTGATGWARSIARQRPSPPELPAPTDPFLTFFVREPFPSRATTTNLEQGCLREGAVLEVISELDEEGTVFGDGIEDDRLEFRWGSRLHVSLAAQRLALVVGA